MNKITVLIFSLITLLAGIYIGTKIQEGPNTDMLLAGLMVGNALLTISTIKNTKDK